ncbi:RHS repeat-associated core domain-containing protein [Leptospira santarosai]|uniref:RHS repeat-associated core domain-containing protein n=1 Tax=Leptospira santarosai TaxID=28183 RepID=UPI00063B26BD|nr:RHS repeat-associated core domain protein [Leptospira santarosai]
MLFGDFVFDISLLQTILFALFAIMTLFQGRLISFCYSSKWTEKRYETSSYGKIITEKLDIELNKGLGIQKCNSTSVNINNIDLVFTPIRPLCRERMDLSDPDAFRYKYAGQEEDKETGLLFYKSRYYDPNIGRFLQADSVVNGSALSGSNLYMYVDGNPLSYRDPAGQNALIHMFNQIVKTMIGFANKNMPSKATVEKNVRTIGRNIDHGARVIGRGAAGMNHNIQARFYKQLHLNDHAGRAVMRSVDHSWREVLEKSTRIGREMGRGIDGAVRKILSGGTYSRNHGTRMWSLDHSITGKFLGHAWQDILDWDWGKILAGVAIVVVVVFFPEVILAGLEIIGLDTLLAGSVIASMIFTAAKLIIEGMAGEEAEDGRPYNTN